MVSQVNGRSVAKINITWACAYQLIQTGCVYSTLSKVAAQIFVLVLIETKLRHFTYRKTFVNSDQFFLAWLFSVLLDWEYFDVKLKQFLTIC